MLGRQDQKAKLLFLVVLGTIGFAGGLLVLVVVIIILLSLGVLSV